MAGGASAHHTLTHFREAIAEKKFDARVNDVTDQLGVISIQGPNSGKIVEELTGIVLNSKTLLPYSSIIVNLKDPSTKGIRIWFRLTFEEPFH